MQDTTLNTQLNLLKVDEIFHLFQKTDISMYATNPNLIDYSLLKVYITKLYYIPIALDRIVKIEQYSYS